MDCWIDGDKSVQRVLQKLLRSSGCDVKGFSSAEGLQNKKLDMVVMMCKNTHLLTLRLYACRGGDAGLLMGTKR